MRQGKMTVCLLMFLTKRHHESTHCEIAYHRTHCIFLSLTEIKILCALSTKVFDTPRSRFIFRNLFIRAKDRRRRIIFFNAYRIKLDFRMKCGGRYGGVGDLRHPNETLIFFSRGSLGQLAQTFASCTG